MMNEEKENTIQEQENTTPAGISENFPVADPVKAETTKITENTGITETTEKGQAAGTAEAAGDTTAEKRTAEMPAAADTEEAFAAEAAEQPMAESNMAATESCRPTAAGSSEPRGVGAIAEASAPASPATEASAPAALTAEASAPASPAAEAAIPTSHADDQISDGNGRDFEAEWRELAEAHPEIIGKTLPEDIFRACVKSGQPPLRVYESMMLQRLQGEIDRLRQENERLRQNETNARRAPVTGTAEGGEAACKEEDPFIAAFKRYR